MKVREVARMTGISPATISRFLKDPNSVKESTKNKIYQIFKDLGKIEFINKSLINRLVIIIPELQNTFYIELCRGIITSAQTESIPCEIFLSFENKQNEFNIFKQIKDYNHTGVIWAPTSENDSIPQLDHCVLLNIDRAIPNVNLKVLCDNVKAAEKATELILKKGVSNPILITGNKNLINAQDRAQGFRNVLEKHHFTDISSRIFYGNFNDSNSGFKIAEDILNKSSCDAILAGNHILAMGIIRALNEKKLTIPKDVSLTTFDLLPGEGTLDYSITEVVFPGFEMGQEAVSLLLQQQSYTPPPQTFKFSADYFVRG